MNYILKLINKGKINKKNIFDFEIPQVTETQVF